VPPGGGAGGELTANSQYISLGINKRHLFLIFCNII
jgi:hypothetical protein